MRNDLSQKCPLRTFLKTGRPLCIITETKCGSDDLLVRGISVWWPRSRSVLLERSPSEADYQLGACPVGLLFWSVVGGIVGTVLMDIADKSMARVNFTTGAA